MKSCSLNPKKNTPVVLLNSIKARQSTLSLRKIPFTLCVLGSPREKYRKLRHSVISWSSWICHASALCRWTKSSRNRRLCWINIEKNHLFITLFHCTCFLIALGLIIMPKVPCYTYAWTRTHFHRTRKSVRINIIDVRLNAANNSRTTCHYILIK